MDFPEYPRDSRISIRYRGAVWNIFCKTYQMLPKIQRELDKKDIRKESYLLEDTDTDFYLPLVNFVLRRHFFYCFYRFLQFLIWQVHGSFSIYQQRNAIQQCIVLLIHFYVNFCFCVQTKEIQWSLIYRERARSTPGTSCLSNVSCVTKFRLIDCLID